MSDLNTQVAEALDKHRDEIMAISGVHGIGVGRDSDYGGNAGPCIVIYLDESADKAQIPERIGGFPVHIVKTEEFSAQMDIL